MSQPLIPTEAQSGRGPKPHLVTIGLVALLSVYFVVVARHASYSVGGSDSSGYANLARSLLQGRVRLPVTEVDTFGVHESLAHVFVPLAYTPVMKDGNSTRVMLPIYPIGFPLHEAVGVLLAGWRLGPFLISPLLAALSCWLLYCIGRRLGLSRPFAAVGSLLLAVNPTFLYLALQPMSDVPATFWGLMMIWAGIRSREQAAWVLLAGFAFGVGFLVRPTNILFLAPLIFCVPLKPRPMVLFVLGGLPLAVLFLSYNYIVFGHLLQTGYSTINLLLAFESSRLARRFNSYSYWMAVTMSPLLLFGWLTTVFLRVVEWKRRALIIAWFASFLLLYVAYDIYEEWWYTRFLLPAYPALILGSLLTAQYVGSQLSGTHGVLRWGAGIVVCTVLFWVPLRYVHRHDLLSFGRGESLHAESCRLADTQLPARAVVVSMEMSGALRFYTERPIIRYDAVVPWLWPNLRRRVLENGYEFFALLMDAELVAAQQSVPGQWTELGRRRHVGLWRIRPDDDASPVIKYGDGFDLLEGDPGGVSWRWMSNVGVVQLRNTGRDMRLRIEGHVPVEAFARPANIKIMLNGAQLETVVARERHLLLEYRITSEQQRGRESSELRLVFDQFMTPNRVDPRNPDKRHLSFSLTRLEWDEAAQ